MRSARIVSRFAFPRPRAYAFYVRCDACGYVGGDWRTAEGAGRDREAHRCAATPPTGAPERPGRLTNCPEAATMALEAVPSGPIS